MSPHHTRIAALLRRAAAAVGALAGSLAPRRLALARIPARAHRTRGQALPFVALVMVFLTMFIMVVVEVGARYQQSYAIQRGIQQANRAAAQSFRYQDFAANQTMPSTAQIQTVLKQAVIANLTGPDGKPLAELDTGETPTTIAQRAAAAVQLYPSGGRCTFPGDQTAHPAVTAPAGTPLLCTSVRVRLKGLMAVYGWGSFSPQIDASELIDRSLP